MIRTILNSSIFNIPSIIQICYFIFAVIFSFLITLPGFIVLVFGLGALYFIISLFGTVDLMSRLPNNAFLNESISLVFRVLLFLPIYYLVLKIINYVESTRTIKTHKYILLFIVASGTIIGIWTYSYYIRGSFWAN